MKTFILFFSMLVTTVVASGPTEEELLAALREDPSNPVALYNLGLMNYLAGDYSGAIKNWKALRDINPGDWQVTEKLVQAYWGAGNSESANLEIAKLRAARESGNYPKLNEKDFFICDQFEIGNIRVFALEYYELTGNSPIAWKFLLQSGDQTLDSSIAVASHSSPSEGTTPMDQRQYHLNGYSADGSRATYSIYRTKPEYAVVRREVQQILQGIQAPTSVTTPTSDENAYHHPPTGIVFPQRLATLQKAPEVTDYEMKSPGLGVSIGYGEPGIKVTIYLYTLGMDSIPDNLQSPILSKHFKDATEAILQIEEIGHYSNVKKLSEGAAQWDASQTDTTSLHAVFSYTERGRECLSHLYLMGFRNHFLKVRFTYLKSYQKPAEEVQRQFLAELSRLLEDSQ